ncbi:MAG TPA: glycosyltransferase family 9 protein [Tepidisphaeraceae bacterium]|jgi:ADP-heptose:LPS heptosyltransferase|nr:glycosyltransferase family 9 protein [Tepidisphaeraceae bacterium]
MGSLTFTSPIRSILVTRLDGLGDIVIGTMLLQGIHAKWPEAKIRLIVRPQMLGAASILPDWVEVISLPFDPREPVAGRTAEIVGQLRQFALAVQSDLAIVAEYNRTWAGEILAAMCGARDIMAFDGPTGINLNHREICQALGAASQESWQTVHVDDGARETEKYAAILDAMQIDRAGCEPAVTLRDEDQNAAAQAWAKTGLSRADAIVCFPSSGEALARSLDLATWVRWIGHLQQSRPVVLFGSEWDAPALDELAAHGLPSNVPRIILPGENPGVMAAFIEGSGCFIGTDTGPMHIAGALGVPTLGIFGGGQSAHRFLPFGKRAAAVRMPIGCYGCEWHCPFDRRHCLKDIPQAALLAAGDAFLAAAHENADAFHPQIFDISPPGELLNVTLGPMMRQHRRFLADHHEIMEHHVFLAEKRSEFADILSRLGSQTHAHIDALAAIAKTIADMTGQNDARDAAIARLNSALSEMTRHNESRDGAIGDINKSLSEMTAHNQSRDDAIAHLNAILAEMTRQNDSRDAAIAHLNELVDAMNTKMNTPDGAITRLRKWLS